MTRKDANGRRHLTVLVATNMGPSPQYPFSDVFVQRQVDTLRALAAGRATIDYFCLRRRFGGVVGSALKYGVAVARFLRACARRYDVVHLHYAYPLLPLLPLYRLLHPRTRLVVSFLGSDVNHQLRRGVRRVLFGRWVRRMDHTVAVSRALAAEAERAFGRTIDTVLGVGVDAQTFYPEPGATKRFDLLFVGRFVPAKGVVHLLEAIRRTADEPVRVCFAGSGPLLGEIQAAATRHAVTVAHQPSDAGLRTLYNESRFLILPSESEGLPVVVGEAFACGIPVIATRVGGVEEVLVDGYNGLFLASPSAEAIVDRLTDVRAMSATTYASLAAHARESAGSLSVQSVCQRQLEIYERLLRA